MLGTGRFWCAQTWDIREGFQEEETLGLTWEGGAGVKGVPWVRNRAYCRQLSREEAARVTETSVEAEEMEGIQEAE